MKKTFCAFLIIIFCTCSSSWAVEKVTPQLRWDHQFQFAGYYTAKYGIDFYGDSLFTDSKTISADPDMVERFKEASIKGWNYALNNIEEIAKHISEDLPRTAGSNNPLKFNIFQSRGIAALMNFPEVELGHINPSRWEKMHGYLKLLGLLEEPLDTNSFIFDYRKLTVAKAEKKQKIFAAIMIIILICFVVFSFLSVFLRRTVRRRTEELSAVNTKLAEREEQFSLAMNFANVGLYDWDLITNTIYYSPVWKRMLGYEPDELKNELSVWEELTDPKDVKASWTMLNEVIEGKRDRFEMEFSMKHKDSNWVVILSRANVVRNASGEAIRVLGTHVDITERKESELVLITSKERLRKQQELFESVFQNLPIMITLYDHPIKKLIVNKEFERNTGWTENDADDGDMMEKIYPDPDDRENALLFIKSGSNEWREFEIMSKSGEMIHSIWSNVKLDDNRRLNIGLDLTEEKKGKKALFESEMKFKRMFEYAPLSYQSLDKSGNFIDVNETWLQTMGYTRYEVIGRKFSEFLVPEWRSHFTENFPRFKAVDETLGIEFEMLKKDGSILLVSFHGKITRDRDGNFERTHCVLSDITLQRDSEEILNIELNINRAIADISKALLEEVYVIKEVADVTLEYAKILTESKHGFVASIDKDTMEMIGHTLTGMFTGQCGIDDKNVIFAIDDNDKYSALWGHALNIKESFYTNEPDDHRSSIGAPEGHISIDNYMAVPVMMGNTLLGLIALANSDHGYSDKDLHSVQRLADVFALGLHRSGYERERTELERTLRQLQKNEAIGVLAGGIAHDFNNILFPIVGFAEMMAEDLPEDSPYHESVSEILSGSLRARDLVKQILAFSRQAEQEIKLLKPNTVINEVVKLMRATIPTYIEIKQNIEPESRTIMADSTQIHQIAMNLVTNAYQAISDDKGLITVSLTNIDLDETDTNVKLHPGPYVLLSIGDTGSGMEKAIIDRIFDPYFSTKAVDKGTGLGLSVVHGIVKNYGGDIAVASTLGKGSVFDVYLPALSNAQAIDAEKKTKEKISGQEKILIVDDEAIILRLVKQMLERLGYDVEATDSSETALEMITNTPELFDLVITDMTMPKMTGERLAKEIKKIKVSLPVIICTGFSDRIDQEGVRDIGAEGFLMKPIVKADLGRMVRNVLDGKNK